MPGSGRKFTELYNVQHLAHNRIDPVASVCIGTIQRVYSMLRGEADLPEGLDEESGYEVEPERRLGQVSTHNSMADQLEVLDDAVAQIPAVIAVGHRRGDRSRRVRREMVVRADSAGGSRNCAPNSGHATSASPSSPAPTPR